MIHTLGVLPGFECVCVCARVSVYLYMHIQTYPWNSLAPSRCSINKSPNNGELLRRLYGIRQSDAGKKGALSLCPQKFRAVLSNSQH